MTRRITVSVPEGLHQKMNRWRQSFNFSKMFQEAMADAIEKKEAFQKRLQGEQSMDEIVERLRREKAESEGQVVESGRWEGLRWAKSAHYEDLRYAATQDFGDDPMEDPRLGAYFRKCIERDDRLAGDSPVYESQCRFYMNGWRESVRSFWEEIKGRI